MVDAKSGTSVLQSHDLNVKTGIDYTGRGTTVFNTQLKNEAFIIDQIRSEDFPCLKLRRDLGMEVELRNTVPLQQTI